MVFKLIIYGQDSGRLPLDVKWLRESSAREAGAKILVCIYIYIYIYITATCNIYILGKLGRILGN